jgi:hypothetical protein
MTPSTDLTWSGGQENGGQKNGRQKNGGKENGRQKNGRQKNSGQEKRRFHFSVSHFPFRHFSVWLLVAKFAKALPGTIYILDAYCIVQVASGIKSGAKPGVKTNH